MTVTQEFKTIRDFILYVLEHKPSTRNCDNELYAECAKMLGAKSIDDMNSIGLSIVSVHKERQIIQNKLHMFEADEEVKRKRKQRQKEFRVYYLSN